MEEENEEVEKSLKEKVNEQVEKYIENVLVQGIQPANIDMLYKLIDIHKDLANEDYWKKKEEVYDMRYRAGDYSGEYGEGYGEESYGRRGVPGSGRGRYREGGNYGRRGGYRGEEMLDEMAEHYGNYRESANYNGQESEKAFDYMLQSAEEFFMYLMEEAEEPQQMEKIKKTARKISEMRM